MPGLEDWLTLARDGEPDAIRERILTGYKDGKPFKCVEVDHHPLTHHLKALQTMPFEAARRRRDGHFELLLRARRQVDASAAHG